MEIEAFTTIVGSLGVPVACMVALFWLWNKEREDHKEELEKVTTALNNNNSLLSRLLDKFEHLGE